MTDSDCTREVCVSSGMKWMARQLHAATNSTAQTADRDKGLTIPVGPLYFSSTYLALRAALFRHRRSIVLRLGHSPANLLDEQRHLSFNKLRAIQLYVMRTAFGNDPATMRRGL